MFHVEQKISTQPPSKPAGIRSISRLPQVLHKSRHFCTTPSVLPSIHPPDTLLLTPMITIHPVNKPKPEPQTTPSRPPGRQDNRRRQPEGRSRQNDYCHQLSRSPCPRRTQNPPHRLRPPGKLHRRTRPSPAMRSSERLRHPPRHRHPRRSHPLHRDPKPQARPQQQKPHRRHHRAHRPRRPRVQAPRSHRPHPRRLLVHPPRLPSRPRPPHFERSCRGRRPPRPHAGRILRP